LLTKQLTAIDCCYPRYSGDTKAPAMYDTRYNDETAKDTFELK